MPSREFSPVILGAIMAMILFHELIRNMKSKFSPKGIILSLSFLLALGWFSFSPDLFEVSKDLEIFSSVFREVNTNYVDQTKPGDLMKKALDAMFSNLDPYTNYIPESEIEDYRFMTTGQYGGVGSLIRKKEDYVVISEPYEGFPAQLAGLQAGDIILEVDGKSVKGKNTEDVSKVLKGQPGTTVKVLISRDGEPGKEYSLVRQEIKVKSVPYSGFVADSIGYIYLTSFTEDCSKEIKKAFEQLEATGKLRALVLDLRGNPGGLLHESVNIANFFLEKGEVVVKTRGRVQEWEKSYKGLNNPLSTTMPIAVLVNSGSASASEIVAGAIQDLDRGVIIGQRTFGKGLVQTTRNISYNSKLKVTTAKYYTPSGRCIQALDYSHRNPDGSVGKVPDSLTNSFLTRAGRKVFDGGGINPDIITEERIVSRISTALERNFHLFDFATRYVRKNPPPVSPAEFKMPDPEFDLFINELSSKDVEFETIPTQSYNQLMAIAKEEGYSNELEQDMKKLEAVIEESKQSSVRTHRDEIRRRTESEIVSRYFFQTGRIQYNLRSDAEIDSAVAVLSNPLRYRNLLEKPAGPGNKK